MIVMEKDAGGKTCVFAIAEALPSCCGSKCMQWRWYRFDIALKKEERKGYCGVSGEPACED